MRRRTAGLLPLLLIIVGCAGAGKVADVERNASFRPYGYEDREKRRASISSP